MDVYKLEKSEEKVTVLFPEEAETQQGAALGVRAAKSSEFREVE